MWHVQSELEREQFCRKLGELCKAARYVPSLPLLAVVIRQNIEREHGRVPDQWKGGWEG